MNECNLVICDGEIQYANGFADNVRMRKELAIHMYICTSVEQVLLLAKRKRIHILLIDEQYPYEERNQVLANQRFVLGKGTKSDVGENEIEINKYQSFDRIIQEVLECYGENADANVIRTVRGERPKMIAVYSPMGGAGKTSFAIALAKESAKKKSTLYLNLEEYPSFEESCEEGMNLGDLLYYLKQDNGNFGLKLQCAIQKKQELHFLLPVPMVLDFKNISYSDWELLLDKIVENSAYKCLILDVGESLQGLFQLLERCDVVYMPMRKDENAKRKIEQYEKQIECHKLGNLQSITQKFFVPENIEEYARMRAREEI